MKGNTRLVGHKHTDASRLAMSVAHKGKPVSRPKGILHDELWKERCRAWMLGNRNGVGRIVTEEEKERTRQMSLRVRRLGKHESSYSQAVRALLEDLHEPYEREALVAGVRGSVDFYLPRLAAVLEVDGDFYHSRKDQPEKDARRNTRLFSLGIPLLRVRIKDLCKEWDLIVESVIGFTGNGETNGTSQRALRLTTLDVGAPQSGTLSGDAQQ